MTNAMKTKQIDQTERQANIVSAIIVTLLAVAGFAYCLKGAIMQIAHNWSL